MTQRVNDKNPLSTPFSPYFGASRTGGRGHTKRNQVLFMTNRFFTIVACLKEVSWIVVRPPWLALQPSPPLTPHPDHCRPRGVARTSPPPWPGCSADGGPPPGPGTPRRPPLRLTKDRPADPERTPARASGLAGWGVGAGARWSVAGTGHLLFGRAGPPGG